MNSSTSNVHTDHSHEVQLKGCVWHVAAKPLIRLNCHKTRKIQRFISGLAMRDICRSLGRDGPLQQKKKLIAWTLLFERTCEKSKSAAGSVHIVTFYPWVTISAQFVSEDPLILSTSWATDHMVFAHLTHLKQSFNGLAMLSWKTFVISVHSLSFSLWSWFHCFCEL